MALPGSSLLLEKGAGKVAHTGGQRFAENDIDFEVLSELTDSDFDRLGVSIGHRRKLLKALAAGSFRFRL